MTTTTVRIDDDLKARVAAAAAQAGKTAHAFILDTIARTVEQVELDEAFNHVADKRWAKILATGNPCPGAMRRSGSRLDRVGERPRKPVARNPRR